MGGSTQKTTQSSTFTPSSIASGIYSDAINRAQGVANTPYDPTTESSVAGFTPDQLAAFQQVNQAQGAWSPYFDQAAQFATQGAGPIDASAISGYMDPYIQQVIDATLAQTNRQDSIEQARLRGNAVSSGALGGNAPAVNSAILAGEQGRNRNSMIANLLSGGYSQALNAAQQDALRQQTAAGQFGQLGTQTQQALYNDVMARLSSGNQQQAQNQQVLDTATANAQQEFLFPYQNTQWLSSIAGSLGPLTGGTTNSSGKTKQGKGIGSAIGAGLSAVASLSDRRAKEDVSRVGFTDDGQPVYKFRYRGSPKFQIGLMADEVEKSHPEAVGDGPYGMKMVNYDKATDFADGGSVFGGKTLMPWAQLPSASVAQPSVGSMPAMKQEDPLKAFEMGKSAFGGLQDLYRAVDPAGGWGASIEPVNGGGSFLSSIGSFFGFANGGEVPPADLSIGNVPLRLADLIQTASMDNGFSGDPSEIYDDFGPFRPAPMLSFEGANELVNPDPNIPSLQIGNTSFASGGAISPYRMSIDEPKRRPNTLGEGAPIISPYGTQPEDEYIGEVGPSGIEDIGEIGPSGAKPEVPWYQQSLTDLLGITEGRSDPTASLTMPKPPVKPRDPLVPNAPQVQNPESSPWSMDDGTVRYKGKSLADYLGRPEPEPKATPAGPFDNPEMIYGDTAAPGGSLTETTVPAPIETQPVETGIPGTLDFIKQQEGFTPNAKWDRRQYSSGYGTRAVEGETIDEAEANRRLQTEVGKVEQWLDNNITVPMSPAARTGLTSFGFNLGVDDLERLKDDINAGNWGRVASRMKTFNKALNDKTGKLETVDGLTDRRIREAALVSGGASLPAEIRELPGEMNQVASKGYAKTDTAAGSKYRDGTDRQTGGLLKRWFGFDFNPLRLSEDERVAMLVAGLSMMSSGDVGKGGLAGLSYLQNTRAIDRKTALDMAKMTWERQKEGNKNLIELLKIEGNQNKPTTDIREYMFAQSNDGYTGSFADFMREKKAAGAGSSEAKARAGMATGFYGDVPMIKKFIQNISASDRVDLQLGRGNAADIWRRIESGRDALIRNMTGAAMPEQEARNYAARYQLSPTDRGETMIRKVEMLERDLKNSFRHLEQYQKKNASSSMTGPIAQNANGDRIQWNGSAWVPLQ